MTLPSFQIDIAHVIQLTIVERWSIYDGKTDITPEDIIKVLKDEDKISSTSSIDHPVFTELREKLGADGFIKIERRWWNGDRVLKPFKLNNKYFKVGEQFSCAAAMHYVLK